MSVNLDEEFLSISKPFKGERRFPAMARTQAAYLVLPFLLLAEEYTTTHDCI